MMQENDDFLKDEMLSHLSKDIGYKPSSDFTQNIMNTVNPPKKKAYLPIEKSANWQQILTIALPLFTGVVFALIGLLSSSDVLSLDGLNINLSDLANNQIFMITVAIGFSSCIYFITNQILIKK